MCKESWDPHTSKKGKIVPQPPSQT